MQDQRIEVRVKHLQNESGYRFGPEDLRLRDLARIITALEDAIVETIDTLSPHRSRNVSLSLISITSGSIHLQFASQIPEANNAFEFLVRSINFNTLINNSYSSSQADFKLSQKALNSLKRIRAVAKQQNLVFELGTTNDHFRPLGVITPTTQLDVISQSRVQTSSFTDQTTIYGRVISVGERKPSAKIALSDGRELRVQVSRKVASELGARLYSWVGLFGEATWSSAPYKLEAFSVSRITEFEDKPSVQASAELSALIGKYFADENTQRFAD